MPGTYPEFITRFNRDLAYFLKHRPDIDLESLDHATPEENYPLDVARDNVRIHNRSGDRIFIISATGIAYIRVKTAGAKYKLRIGSISLPFKNLYLTNTAQAGKAVSLIIGYEAFIDFAVSYLAVKILNVADAEINPSTEEKQALLLVQLDIKLSALRDAITDGTTPKDLKDLYDQLYTMRGAATPKSLKDLWDKLNTIGGKDFATQTTLALIKAKTDNLDVALSTLAKETGGNLASVKANTDKLNVNLSTVATQTTLNLIKLKTDNLNLTISALRDAICDATTPKDLKDLWDKLDGLATEAGNLATIAGKDFATQTTLALIKAKTDNLTDLASQTTLALIKAKTDNLDLAITSLRDAICDSGTPKDLKDLWDKLTSVIAHLARINSGGTEGGYTNIYDVWYLLDRIDGWTEFLKLNSLRPPTNPLTYTVTMTNANQEYEQALPTGSREICFLIRGGDVAYRYAWVTGKVATPTDPYTEVPKNGVVGLRNVAFYSKTLYFACATAGKVMQIEVIADT